MSKYAHSQLLVNSILEFFKTVTDVLFFYIESSDECQTFHLTLLNLIVVYRNTQIEKYRRMVVDDDERLENQTRDLCALIEILCYSVSKTFMPTYDGAGSVEHSAKVALSGQWFWGFWLIIFCVTLNNLGSQFFIFKFVLFSFTYWFHSFLYYYHYLSKNRLFLFRSGDYPAADEH